MRQNKNSSPTTDKPILDEPVYVDDAFPEEEIPQDDPWAQDEAIEDLKLESTLEELLKETGEKEPPKDVPAPKPNLPTRARSYRVKISPQSPKQFSNQQQFRRHSLPNELPRPTRRENRRDDRTGSWPVEHPSKRNGALPAKSLHTPASSPPHERSIPAEKPQNPSPSERTPSSPTDKASREIRPVIEFRPTLRPQPVSKPASKSAPPPVLPVMPIKPDATTRQDLPSEDGIIPLPFPTQKPVNNGNAFKPLVDEASSNGIAGGKDTGWDQITPARPREDLQSFIGRLELPQNSLILGVCDDGLPLVLELSDPSTGALLFLGEDVGSMQKHLLTILASVCLLSDPKQVQVDVISPDQDAFDTQAKFSHIQKMYLPDQDEVFELLGGLFELIEQRQRKDNSLTGKFLSGLMPPNKGPIKILLIDQLDVLVEQLAPESLAYLRWLLRRGPAANVWVLASLNTLNAQNLDGKTLKSFGLKIAGKLQNSHLNDRLTTIPVDTLSSLETGEACLQLDQETIQFSILEI